MGQMSLWGDFTSISVVIVWLCYLCFHCFSSLSYILLYCKENYLNPYLEVFKESSKLLLNNLFFTCTRLHRYAGRCAACVVYKPRAGRPQLKFLSSVKFKLGGAFEVGNSTPKPSPEFMAMFIGLVDGDGYIEITEQEQYNSNPLYKPKSTIRCRLVIRLHERDKNLLENISKILNAGWISHLDRSKLGSADQTRLIFSKKDLSDVIIPLMKEYGLKFLTGNRAKQYALLTHILENNLVHWDDDFKKFYRDFEIDWKAKKGGSEENINLLALNLSISELFPEWVVGFTVAEGSFFFKADGGAFYQIKQKGIENYHLIKAISYLIVEKNKIIKPDSANCYQLSLSSIQDIQKVVNFFSGGLAWERYVSQSKIEGVKKNKIGLCGYKLIQYNEWLRKLKLSERYKNIKIT